MNIYRARLVIPMRGSPIPDGAVVVRGSTIIGVGPYLDIRRHFSGEVDDLAEVVLLPGLINAHCHLDYTALRGAILSQQSFAGWVQRINAVRRTLTDEDFIASIATGFEEARRWGTTSILNIESYPELMLRLPPPPLRTWWFFEMLDVRNRLDGEETIAGALSFFEKRNDWMGGFGLSPHAPYTASLELYRAAAACSENYAMPFVTHLAESDEEFQMFSQSDGALFEFLHGLGRPMDDVGGKTPIAHLLENDALPTGALLVHMNEIAESDYELLSQAAWNRRLFIVHCPGTHRYFGRQPFPLDRLRSAGFSLSLGTDSLASNRSLSLFEEMRILREDHPQVSTREALEMVTLNPARALRLVGRLGELSPNSLADMIAIPYDGASNEAHDAIVDYHGRVDWMLLHGRRI